MGARTGRAALLMLPAHALILDFNGTLAADGALLLQIYEELLREHGVPFGPREYRLYAGLPDQAMFARVFEADGRPLDETTVAQLMRERVARYRAALGNGHPVSDDTVAFVRVAAAHVPVAIASGAFREEIEHVLELAGLDELVSVIVSIDEVEAGKPDPESFTAALGGINRGRSERIAPRNSVVVEDATDGARAAVAAGMRCVALRGGAYDEGSGVAEVVVDGLTADLARALVRAAL